MNATVRRGLVAGFEVVVLENSRIRAVVIPSLGGRVWELVDRIRHRQWIWHRTDVGLVASPPGSCYDDIWAGGWEELFPNNAPGDFEGRTLPDHGEGWMVVSKFETHAREIEIDAVAEAGRVVLWAISEHVENAGVHSGDATLVLPPQSLYLPAIRRARDIADELARALEITGPFNVQFVAKNNEVKVIESTCAHRARSHSSPRCLAPISPARPCGACSAVVRPWTRRSRVDGGWLGMFAWRRAVSVWM